MGCGGSMSVGEKLATKPDDYVWMFTSHVLAFVAYM